jgi:hypothetical protein
MPARSKQRSQVATLNDASVTTRDENDQPTTNQHQVDYRVTQSLLTPAMQAFPEHWAINRNQIKAYQFAYPRASVATARAEARRLFADPRIQAEIHRVSERQIDHTRSTLMQAERVLSQLAHADVRRLFGRGAVLLDPHDWDADIAAAVSSYSETPTRYGIVRKVRLHDKHAAARTLLEAKGAFEKHKAPPGVAAIFNISMGGRTMQLGAPIDRGRTITEDVARPGKLTEARRLPKPSRPKAATRPIAKAKVLFGEEP